MAASKVRLKLLIDTMGHKVLFAEASKDFVDFLIYLFLLPVGTVVKLFKKKNMVGSLRDLYESIENLSETYIQPNQNKNSLLNPRSPICATEIPLLLSDLELETAQLYLCHKCKSSVADVSNLPCPKCQEKMTAELSYVPQAAAAANSGALVDGGFVKGVVTYMVMDNLEVMPMSTISSITLLNKFNVKDVGALEERIVDFGIDEGMKLLKESMECKTVLTNVYLGKAGK